MGFNLSNISRDLLGKPYKLGDMDCLTLIFEFSDRSGMPIPREWKGMKVGDHVELYKTDPIKAQETLIEWVSQVGSEIAPSRAFAGDLLLVYPKGPVRSGPPSVVIHAGQDQVMAVYETRGVLLAPLRAYEIVKAYRWIEQRKRKRPLRKERM